jgi:hypothetical protein
MNWLWFAARAVVAAICLLTWAYGLVVSVPFAFEAFIRPQLFPWLAQFVIWHHAWYWLALLLSAVTLTRELAALRTQRTHLAGWVAAAYLFFFGAIGVHLLSNPFLVTLDGGERSWVIVPGALLPLLWLALIDHLAAAFPADQRPRHVTGQRRLFAACVATGVSVWLIHQVVAVTWSSVSGGWSGRAATAVWAMALDVAALFAVFALLSFVTSFAAARRRPFEWEYAAVVALAAAGISEFVRRMVLPSLAFTEVDAAIGAIPFGIVMASVWSGWRLRFRPRDRPAETALAMLSPAFDGRSFRSLVLVAIVAVVGAVAYRSVEQIDWGLINNRTIAAVEVTLIFGFFLARYRDRQDDSWSARRAVVAPVAALLVLASMPFASAALLRSTPNPHLQPEMALERLPVIDPFAGVIARLWVEQQPQDLDFHRAITTSPVMESTHKLALPATTFVPARVEVRAPLPNVFVFVIDSLRRDYLSPYNPAVSFTPSIAAFAADGYVFTNAFTKYGGTWMAIPSLWTGAPLTRSWGQLFKQMNAIEPVIKAAAYDFVVNEHSVQPLFSTPQTFVDRDVASVGTDLCANVAAVRAHVESRKEPRRPLFTYLAPMNVHILNTRTPSRAPADPRYAGFYQTYAEKLERIDGCFGSFLAYLKDHDLYDNSIIILTSDHGESLGAEGNWGHQYFLFPEDVRIPMIIHLPQEMRQRFTTDLAQVALLPDLAPTLLTLLGQSVPDLGAPFGATLFVPPDRAPAPRRRESFLLMSSYGSSFALLRRNGKSLYISDLVNLREYGYTLFEEPLGRRVPVTDTLRRTGQAGIRAKVAEVEAIYRPR